MKNKTHANVLTSTSSANPPARPLALFFFCPKTLVDAHALSFSSVLLSYFHYTQIAVDIARRSAVSIAAAHAAVSGKRKVSAFKFG